MQCKIHFVLGIFIGTLSCIVKLPDEVCPKHTKLLGDNKTILQLNTFDEVLLTGLSGPFRNILYNLLAGSEGKWDIAKGLSKAGISELVPRKTTLSPEDLFENIEAILI